MMASGLNLVMTVIGCAVSTLFIVFVCTRLIWARIQLNAARRSFERESRSDLSSLERGVHGLDANAVANFPTKKYRELCFSSKENSQCTVCLAEYNEEDMLRILPMCGHSFHAACIDTWLQQQSTCPVCRISLRQQIPNRKWFFMQPMFSSAIRSQNHPTQSLTAHYCYCMGNGDMHSSRSLDDNQTVGHVDDRFLSEGNNGVNLGDDRNSVSADQTTKEATNRKSERKEEFIHGQAHT